MFCHSLKHSQQNKCITYADVYFSRLKNYFWLFIERNLAWYFFCVKESPMILNNNFHNRKYFLVFSFSFFKSIFHCLGVVSSGNMTSTWCWNRRKKAERWFEKSRRFVWPRKMHGCPLTSETKAHLDNWKETNKQG